MSKQILSLLLFLAWTLPVMVLGQGGNLRYEGDQKPDKLTLLEQGQQHLKRKVGQVTQQLTTEQLAMDSFRASLANQQSALTARMDELTVRLEDAGKRSKEITALQEDTKSLRTTLWVVAAITLVLLILLALWTLARGRKIHSLEEALDKAQSDYQNSLDFYKGALDKTIGETEVLRGELHSQAAAHKQDWEQLQIRVTKMSEDTALHLDEKAREIKAQAQEMVSGYKAEHASGHTEMAKQISDLIKKLEGLDAVVKTLNKE